MTRFDVVVIGAGSAGAVLASRLSEDPSRSVLLIEAGPDYPDFDELPSELKFGYGTGTDIVTRSHNWTFYGRATDQNPRMLVPRGKVTGGTSAINGQVWRWAVPEDFARWTAAGNDLWTWERVVPYFQRAETDLDHRGEPHGDAGPIPISRIRYEAWQPVHKAFFHACRSLGYAEDADQNRPGSIGVGPRAFNNFNGLRMSTALCYLGQARERANLTIWPHSTARRIVFRGRRACGVQVNGPFARRVDGGEIVVCAGAIGSPHLLLLSGVGPARELERVSVPVIHDAPGVGRNLRDHPMVFIEYRAAPGDPYRAWAPRMPLDLRYTADGSDARADMHLVIGRVRAGKGSLQALGAGRAYAAADHGDASLGVRLTAGLHAAAGAGELRLVASDPAVPPLLDYNFLQEEIDRRRLREAVRLCRRIAATPELEPFVDGPIGGPSADELECDEALDRWLTRTVTTEQHLSSTCRMGPSADPAAVVDQVGRVHGVDGLRVVDASVMPDCVRANPNATTIMLAELIADTMAGHVS